MVEFHHTFFHHKRICDEGVRKQEASKPLVLLTSLAERMGFEPMVGCPTQHFQCCTLRPLGHLSLTLGVTCSSVAIIKHAHEQSQASGHAYVGIRVCPKRTDRRGRVPAYNKTRDARNFLTGAGCGYRIPRMMAVKWNTGRRNLSALGIRGNFTILQASRMVFGQGLFPEA